MSQDKYLLPSLQFNTAYLHAKLSYADRREAASEARSIISRKNSNWTCLVFFDKLEDFEFFWHVREIMTNFLFFLLLRNRLNRVQQAKFHQIYEKSRFERKTHEILHELNSMKSFLISLTLWRVFFLKFWSLSGAKVCTSCRSRKIIKNAAK